MTIVLRHRKAIRVSQGDPPFQAYRHSPSGPLFLKIPPVFPRLFFHPPSTLELVSSSPSHGLDIHATASRQHRHCISFVFGEEVIHGTRGRAEDVPVPWKMNCMSDIGEIVSGARTGAE